MSAQVSAISDVRGRGGVVPAAPRRHAPRPAADAARRTAGSDPYDEGTPTPRFPVRRNPRGGRHDLADIGPVPTADEGSTGMAITRDEVANLARLSRMSLSSAELDALAPQLEAIIGAVARVSEVAAADIPPTSHAVPLTNVFRADVTRPSLPVADVLAGAPAAEDGRFRVPRILDPEE
ncbi:glutamyl-tRNA(Gln) and/or aspartyl-tRNA(Asn) amidotransferase, C subunit [Frankia sp. EI5c]|nr:glutamyl-tRNA(Gln) and/or aspartyl-tRNA(Asn) amidotransferase, C subunit [Frankia sp. EI5c]